MAKYHGKATSPLFCIFLAEAEAKPHRHRRSFATLSSHGTPAASGTVSPSKSCHMWIQLLERSSNPISDTSPYQSKELQTLVIQFFNSAVSSRFLPGPCRNVTLMGAWRPSCQRYRRHDYRCKLKYEVSGSRVVEIRKATRATGHLCRRHPL